VSLKNLRISHINSLVTVPMVSQREEQEDNI